MTKTREGWLIQAVAVLKDGLFLDADIQVPAVRVSCGFPKGNVKKVIGQCWATTGAEDGVAQLFISPMMDDPVKVLATLVHELVHAVDNCEHAHRGPFVKMIRALGLEGRPTATVAGPDLRDALQALVDDVLGEYPHSALQLSASPVKPQKSRMLKLECPEDGYIVRTTKTNIEIGLPRCPCGEELLPEETDDDD